MVRHLAFICATAAFLCGGAATAAEAVEAGDVDDALSAARTRLVELRRVCKDAHPAVQAELRRIEELERRRRQPRTPAAELAFAREQLAELRRTCKDGHPAVQAQLRLIAELERKAGASPSTP